MSVIDVFPAHAGMFLRVKIHSSSGFCFPRARGDVPDFAMATMSTDKFSPRTRGCSEVFRMGLQFFQVFPAHAGMFRCYHNTTTPKPRFPRARGDVPIKGVGGSHDG